MIYCNRNHILKKAKCVNQHLKFLQKKRLPRTSRTILRKNIGYNNSPARVAGNTSSYKAVLQGSWDIVNFPRLWTTWNAKCPMFLGNFTPKTSNSCLKKIEHLAFQACLFSMFQIPRLEPTFTPVTDSGRSTSTRGISSSFSRLATCDVPPRQKKNGARSSVGGWWWRWGGGGWWWWWWWWFQFCNFKMLVDLYLPTWNLRTKLKQTPNPGWFYRIFTPPLFTWQLKNSRQGSTQLNIFNLAPENRLPKPQNHPFSGRVSYRACMTQGVFWGLQNSQFWGVRRHRVLCFCSDKGQVESKLPVLQLKPLIFYREYIYKWFILDHCYVCEQSVST